LGILAGNENPEFAGEEKIMKTAFWKTTSDPARDGRRDQAFDRKRSFSTHA
jgi:hypothetical protein